MPQMVRVSMVGSIIQIYPRWVLYSTGPVLLIISSLGGLQSVINSGLLICFGFVAGSEYVALPISYSNSIICGVSTIIVGDDVAFHGWPMTAMVKYFSSSVVRFATDGFANPTHYFLTIGY